MTKANIQNAIALYDYKSETSKAGKEYGKLKVKTVTTYNNKDYEEIFDIVVFSTDSKLINIKKNDILNIECYLKSETKTSQNGFDYQIYSLQFNKGCKFEIIKHYEDQQLAEDGEFIDNITNDEVPF